MKHTVLLLSAFAASSASAAKAPEFDTMRLLSHARILSSDEFEGRGPNSAGEQKTVAYLVEQFKAAGLQPGGDLKHGKRQWTQDVPLGRFEIKGPVQASLSFNGNVRPLAQGEQIAIRAAATGQSAVRIEDAPLVFVGFGVSAPERDWNDFKGTDLKGKIAVVLINDPDYGLDAGDFGGKAMTYYGRWVYKFEEMARQGALGTMIVHETEPAAYGWPTVKNSNTITMFDIVRKEPAKAHAPLESWIQRDLAVDLFKQAGLDFEAAKAQARRRDFRPIPLDGVRFSADFAVDAQVIRSQNVVGRLEGRRHPEQTVIHSAHWDHLGVGSPNAAGDTIYNGAVDNATSLAALIELGRAYSHAPRTARSLVFLAVTAEEKGLLGSEYYASNPLYPLATTAGVINMDMLNTGGETRDFSIFGSAKLDLLDRLLEAGRKWGMGYSPDSKPEAGYFFRSDHFPLAKRGVPALTYSPGDDLIDGGKAAGEAARNAYVAERYHQPTDEFDGAWTFAGMTRDLQVMYTLGRGLADSADWPNWSADSEFRAARDASAAERGQ
ncbi:MAG: M28 family metallopeptidase [Arenimonas sp.]